MSGLVVAGLVGAAALALLAVALRRPQVGCALLMLLVPLTTGLARGSLIPVLKPSEAMVGIVCAAALLKWLAGGPAQELSWLDLAVAAYVTVGVGIPTFVLLLSATAAGADTWREVLAPLQFGAVYLLFSRTAFSARDLRLVLALAMLGGALAGVVGLAELVNVPGLRTAIATYYTTTPMAAWDTTYRPESLVGHYSALGGLCLLNVILAATLAGSRHPAFDPRLLTALLLANVGGTVVSLTFAPFLLLPVVLAAAVVAYRRLPRELIVTVAALAAGLLVLWPSVSGRASEQGLLSAGQLSLAPPETLVTRVRFWTEFIVPALRDHLWLGTGTVIPGTVPSTLGQYVDNEYLWAGFRAGVPGIAALLLLLLAVVVAGWRDLGASDPWRRAVGPAAALSALSILAMGLTAQYLTFGGIVQEFAMLAGLSGGLAARRPQAATALLLVPSATTNPRGPRLGQAARPCAADPPSAAVAHLPRRRPTVASGSGWLWSRTRLH